MKKLICLAAFCIMLIGIVIHTEQSARSRIEKESVYGAAEVLMAQERYEEAMNILEDLKDPNYKSADALWEICRAHLLYDEDHIGDAWSSMTLLRRYHNTSYLSSNQQEALRTFQNKLKSELPDYYARQSRLEQEREMQAIRSGIPYVGMLEQYINDTSLGPPSSEVRHNYECIGGEQFLANLYDFKDGNATIFTARCVQGRVVQVWDSRDNPTSRPAYHPSSSNHSDAEDRYHIDRYRNAEDFYYDNYNDFIDYYAAEDYFNEHKR